MSEESPCMSHASSVWILKHGQITLDRAYTTLFPKELFPTIKKESCNDYWMMTFGLKFKNVVYNNHYIVVSSAIKILSFY